MTDYKLTIEESPSPEDIARINRGLVEYNLSHAIEANHQFLRIFLRDEGGRIFGGLLGEIFWGWLHVDALWVDESLRGEGHGSKLMAAAEAEAVKRGCRHCFLDTFTFQAQPFYEKLGYAEFGVLEDYRGEHKKIFLHKMLSAD